MEKAKQAFKSIKRYHRLKLLFFFIHFLVFVVFLWFFVSLGGARQLEEKVQAPYPWARVCLYAFFLSLFLTLMTLPVHYLGDYVLEKRYGLSTLSFRGWCAREGKKAALSFLFFLILVESGYFLVWTFGERWWVGFGILWFVYHWALSQLFPVWIVPLFYRYRPLEDAKLVQLLKTFASRHGRTIDSVRVLDLSRETRKANAAVLGIGKRKRIVLGDTLLEHFSHDEIKVVFAHELGHDIERHLIASLLFNGAVIFGGIYLVHRLLLQTLPFFHVPSLEALPALPLFLFFFSLFGLVLMPLQNGFSRHLERRADAFALRTTGLKDIFISAMKKLATQNLADEHPHRLVEILFHTHPSIGRRVEFAKHF